MKKIVIALAVAAAALVFAGTSMAYDLAGIQIHGFISQGFSWSQDNSYPTSDSESGTFQHFDAGINFGKKLTDGLNIGLQLYARDFGNIDNNTVNIDWAYADYKWQNWLKMRFGKMKAPFGLYGEGRDIDMLKTFAFLPQTIYTEASREINMSKMGVGIYGSISAGPAGSFDYNLVVGEPQLDESEGGMVQVFETLTGASDISFDFELGPTAQVIWNTPLDGFRAAFTYLYQPTDFGGVFDTPFGPVEVTGLSLDTEIWIASVEYTWNSLVVAAEYASYLLKDMPDQQRYYLSGSYRFTDLLEAGLFYGVYYPDEDDKDGENQVAMGHPDFSGWQKDLCAALRFDLNAYWIFKIEGHYVNGTADVLPRNTPFDSMEEDWFYGVAKTTFSF